MRSIPNIRAAAAGAAITFLAASALAQTVDGKPEVKAKVLTSVTSLIDREAYVPGIDFAKWKEFMTKAKPKFDAAKDDDEFADSINEAFTQFGMSHLTLITPNAMTRTTSGRMVGIGIQPAVTETGTLIVRTIPGGPAEKAGLIAGDTIVKVDGQPASGAKGIAGTEGTKLVLTIRHADGTTAEYTLTRAPFSTRQPEELIPIDKDTARLAIHTFDMGYDGKNVETLMRQAASYKNLIVDMRGNPGGAVLNVQHLLGMLVPNKPIGTFVDRDLAKAYVEATGGKEGEAVKIAAWSRTSGSWDNSQLMPFPNRAVPVYTGHVAVLVDGGSGSGAEITAAALAELDGAPVVGTPSAGAVLVAYRLPVAKGFYLELPIMDYVTAKGVRLEKTGVVPTAKVEPPKSPLFGNAKDPVVERATAILETPTLSAAAR